MFKTPHIWRRKSQEPRVGVTLAKHGFSACALRGEQITRAAERTSSQAAAGQALARWVREEGLEGARTAAVLDQEDYEFHLIDRPAVASEELRDATLWSINQRTSTPINGGEVEWLAEPASVDGAHPDRIYAAACPRNTLENLARQLSDAKLQLSSIRIPETLQCLSHPHAGAQVLTTLRGCSTGALLSLSVGTEFHVSRRINLPADSAAASASIEDAAQGVEGCLDYFQNRFGFPRPSIIQFSDHPATTPGLQALREQLGGLDWQAETIEMAGTHLLADPTGQGVSAAVLAAIALPAGASA